MIPQKYTTNLTRHSWVITLWNKDAAGCNSNKHKTIKWAHGKVKYTSNNAIHDKDEIALWLYANVATPSPKIYRLSPEAFRQRLRILTASSTWLCEWKGRKRLNADCCVLARQASARGAWDFYALRSYLWLFLVGRYVQAVHFRTHVNKFAWDNGRGFALELPEHAMVCLRIQGRVGWCQKYQRFRPCLDICRPFVHGNKRVYICEEKRTIIVIAFGLENGHDKTDTLWASISEVW